MPDERGVHADAARAREGALTRQLRVAVGADRAVEPTVRDARQAVLRGRRQLDAIDAEIEAAVANQRVFGVGTPTGARRFSGFLAVKAHDIYQVITEAEVDSQARAALLQSLGSRYGTDDPDARSRPTIQAVDNHTGQVSDEERRQNQILAFTRVFGHEPVSATDWATAAALDCHTYRPEFQGTESQVRVARIRPEPGQGLVRVSQWIPQRDVKSGFTSRNFGNDRVPDAQFDPEATKVTTYIDYQNGIVVLRQNPSVELDHRGGPGQVKIDAPHGSVMQADDGSVRIRYEAGNPFAPGFSTDPHGPLGDHRLSVNGDLVFTPTAGGGGVHVDGTRTNYPSMEVYQDLPNGDTHTVLIDPARSGRSLGPVLNLPRHHDIGIGGHAFEPFNRGDWNRLPSSAFRPVTALPSAAPTPSIPVRVPA